MTINKVAGFLISFSIACMSLQVLPAEAESRLDTEPWSRQCTDCMKSALSYCPVLVCCKSATGSVPATPEECLKSKSSIVKPEECKGDNALVCCNYGGKKPLAYATQASCKEKGGSTTSLESCASEALACMIVFLDGFPPDFSATDYGTIKP